VAEKKAVLPTRKDQIRNTKIREELSVLIKAGKPSNPGRSGNIPFYEWSIDEFRRKM
jgi:hypothetical protein